MATDKPHDPQNSGSVLPDEADLNPDPERKEAPNAENKGVSRINTVSIALAVIAMVVIGVIAFSSF